MGYSKECGSCGAIFVSESATVPFCPSCSAARLYDSRVRCRLKKQGQIFLPHCARCGAETLPKHRYCLACATIRRMESDARTSAKWRDRQRTTDFEAEKVR